MTEKGQIVFKSEGTGKPQKATLIVEGDNSFSLEILVREYEITHTPEMIQKSIWGKPIQSIITSFKTTIELHGDILAINLGDTLSKIDQITPVKLKRLLKLE